MQALEAKENHWNPMQIINPRIPIHLAMPQGQTDVVFELRGSETPRSHPAFFFLGRVLRGRGAKSIKANKIKNS